MDVDKCRYVVVEGPIGAGKTKLARALAHRLLADTLRNSGARYEKGKNWAPYVVKDGNLLSGQNPASTAPLVDAVLAELV